MRICESTFLGTGASSIGEVWLGIKGHIQGIGGLIGRQNNEPLTVTTEIKHRDGVGENPTIQVLPGAEIIQRQVSVFVLDSEKSASSVLLSTPCRSSWLFQFEFSIALACQVLK